MHSPARQILKDAVASIGNIRSASFDFSQLSSKYKALVNGELPNIFNPEMKTGALNDLGVYCVYPAVDLFGVPEERTTQKIVDVMDANPLMRPLKQFVNCFQR